MTAKRAVRSIVAALAIAVASVLVALVAATGLGGASADQSYHSLNYDVTVLGNGDLKITQLIDMKLKKRDGVARGGSCTSSTSSGNRT
jgi:hypothetical protein